MRNSCPWILARSPVDPCICGPGQPVNAHSADNPVFFWPTGTAYPQRRVPSSSSTRFFRPSLISCRRCSSVIAFTFPRVSWSRSFARLRMIAVDLALASLFRQTVNGCGLSLRRVHAAGRSLPFPTLRGAVALAHFVDPPRGIWQIPTADWGALSGLFQRCFAASPAHLHRSSIWFSLSSQYSADRSCQTD